MAPRGENNIVVVPNMKLEKVFCMKGGNGEAAMPIILRLRETLDGVQLTSPEVPFTVVDLGCSSGSNTIFTIETIIKHMSKRYEEAGFKPPEFSAFFSDLPSNDFKPLFQLLPPIADPGVSMEEYLAAKGHRSYFAAAVPGSFYKRLFPCRSINLFHSAFSLHWLSQGTASAYKKQFQSDLSGFLRSRAQEMMSGGSMFLVCLGRTSVDPTDQGGAGLLFGTHFQDAWNDLVLEWLIWPSTCPTVCRQYDKGMAGGSAEVFDQSGKRTGNPFLTIRSRLINDRKIQCIGLITSEKRDNFNIPVYAPSIQDFREVVEANGSFTINKLEVFKGGSPLVVNQPDDEAEVGRALANSCRSVAGVLIDAHIGEELSKELFLRVEHKGQAMQKKY
ncbi:Indole-3-acetate O-methyltransferase 1 [Vitis vinifera]|uniref:Indole-3-acetate O-methyltransferase 1 n=1 Tax=Vitis vinifera TaxID=29760 RepID=A0A438H5M9_VITVI|nr:Indole-3-acetate O-methyltransferase 1 [Vitis vinifera]